MWSPLKWYTRKTSYSFLHKQLRKIGNYSFSGSYKEAIIRDTTDGTIVSSITLQSFPTCSGIVIFEKTWGLNLIENKKLKSLLMAYTLKYATAFNYQIGICTVNANDTDQIKIMEENNWLLMNVFVEPITGDTINTYQICLT